MGAHNFAPNYAELRSRNRLLCFVNISNFLSEVKVAAFFVIHTINLEQRSVVVCITASSKIRLLEMDGVKLMGKSIPLETKNSSFDIKSHRLRK